MFVCYVCRLWIFLSKSLCGHMLSFSLDKPWEWNCWVILAQLVKNLPAVQETWFWSLGRKEDPLEEGMATRSSILVWRIPWTEEPGGLLSVVLQRVGHNWATNTMLCSVDPYKGILLSNKRQELLVHTTTWMNPNMLTLSERSWMLPHSTPWRRHPLPHCLIPFMYNSRKSKLIYSNRKQSSSWEGKGQWGTSVDIKVHGETLLGSWICSLFLWSDGFTAVYIYQNIYV